jgi:enolase
VEYFSGEEMQPFSYAVSLAFARLASSLDGQELFLYLRKQFGFKGKIQLVPLPLCTMFNGGLIADTNLDFQEFLFIPKRQSPLSLKIIEAGNTEIQSYVALSASVYRELGLVLQEAGYDSDTGLQGGYAPDMDSSLEALEMMMAAASRVGLEAGRDFSLGIDIGSFTLYDPDSGRYLFPLDQASFAKEDMVGLYNSWLAKFPIEYLEDALAGGNWESWRDLTAALGSGVVVAGDEVFASREDKLREGMKEQAANAIVVKPDKAGTLSSAARLCALAKRHGYGLIMSQRSSETNDDALADLAVAFEAQFVKAGATARGERVAKYNRLLEIFEIIRDEDGKR